MTTYRQFVDNIAALDVVGVQTKYAYWPDQITETNFPMLYLRLPTGNDSPIVNRQSGGWPTLRCDVVILTETINQSRDEERFNLDIEIMDNFVDALCTAGLSKGTTRWSIESTIVNIGVGNYHAVIANIESTG